MVVPWLALERVHKTVALVGETQCIKLLQVRLQYYNSKLLIVTSLT